MADTTIRKLLVRLGVEADTKNVAEFDKEIANAVVQLRDMLQAGASAIAEMAKFAQQASRAAGATEEAATEIESATESVEGFASASEQAGAAANDVAMGAATEAAALDDVEVAARGAEDAIESLAGSNQAASASFVEGSKRFTEGFEKIEGGANRAIGAARELALVAAGAVVGLVGLVFTAAEAVRASEELGESFDAEAVEAANELSDGISGIIDFVLSLRNAVGLVLLPEIASMVSRFRDWATANKEVIQQRLEEYAERIADGLERAEAVIEKVVDRMGGWENALKLVTAGIAALTAAWAALKIGTVVAGILQVVQGFAALGASGGTLLIAFGALLPILQVWGAFALIIDDLLTYFRGGDSVIGRFIDRFREGEGFVGAFARALESALGFAQEAFPVVSGLFGQVLSIFEQLYQLAQPLIDLLATGFGMVIEGYLMPFTLALEGIGLLFDALIPKVSQFGALASSVLSGVSGLLGGGADTSGLAPSTPESTVGGGGGSTSNSTTTVNNYNGLNTSDIEALNAAEAERAARSASEAGTAGVV